VHAALAEVMLGPFSLHIDYPDTALKLVPHAFASDPEQALLAVHAVHELEVVGFGL
jgi:hypothetical protein